MSHERTMDLIRQMVSEREWGQFHTPENLAKSISIESGELLECFQWGGEAGVDAVQAELADVLTYCFLLADALGLEVDEIVQNKLLKTQEKYPVDLAKGRSTKYDRL
ncbi:nucleotide pyrophosphohydrolase [Cellulosimicrobium funkei]|nr:nucleotide pyrophosphohydrolase [Cellulosimicrobium funkei]